MGAKNVKVFIWLGFVVAILLMSSEVLAVKDLAEKTCEFRSFIVETTKKNGVKDPKYGASLIGVNCGKRNCCLAGSNRFCTYCITCCT
ncbi:hypothetical protein MKX01_012664 [Papaver californicum]|nr:hypothetical protein MKX01_012664 [Papaver californicum]